MSAPVSQGTGAGGLRPFGRLEDGTAVTEVTLATEAGAEARIITWGGVLRDLIVPGPGGRRRVLLGLDRLEDYVAYSPFFGAIVGRYANRIGRARFRLSGRCYDLVPNENGNELHGGPGSFGRRPWTLLGHDRTRAHLALVSEDGDMGYPGRLFATCTYELLEPATLRVTLQAIADQATPVNLTLHGYYNLDGSADARDHRLAVWGDFTTPTDLDLIPTGEVTGVAGTWLDFRTGRPFRDGGPYRNLDVNFVVRRERSTASVLAHAATLSTAAGDLAMELWTTEPGLQVYDGHLIDVPVAGTGGLALKPYAGIALEPQRFPDAPNQAHFPACTLVPGRVSRQMSELRFGIADV